MGAETPSLLASTRYTSTRDRVRFRLLTVARQVLTMCVEFHSTSELLYVDPPPPPPTSRNLDNLNIKSEADHRKT